MEPKISVILPIYNMAGCIRECIANIARQTLREIEIICVDDGSTDDTRAILDETAAQDARIQVITQQNSYAGVARNTGFARATGKYVIFLDPDDKFDDDMLRQIYETAEKHAAEVVIFGNWLVNAKTGEQKKAPYSLDFVLRRGVFAGRDDSARLFQLASQAPWNKLFLRSFIQKTGLQFQPLRNTNDVFFTQCALARAERIYCLKKRFVYYYIANSGSLQGSRKKARIDFAEAVMGVRKYLEANNLMETYKHTFAVLALNALMHSMSAASCVDDFKQFYTRIADDHKELLRSVDGRGMSRIRQRMLHSVCNESADEYLLNCARKYKALPYTAADWQYKCMAGMAKLPDTLTNAVKCIQNKP